MRAKPRDTQRSAVYRWDEQLAAKTCKTAFESSSVLSLDECQALICRVWSRFGQTTRYPTVRDGRGRRSGCYVPWCNVIKLPRFARRPVYVCHEVTHGLMNFANGVRRGELPAHGREFARLAMDVYNQVLGIELTTLRRVGMQLEPRRVHFATLARMKELRVSPYYG